jgi:hypothetical protein
MTGLNHTDKFLDKQKRMIRTKNKFTYFSEREKWLNQHGGRYFRDIKRDGLRVYVEMWPNQRIYLPDNL